MYTDASAFRLGAVLMQQDVWSKHSDVAYASRTLNQTKSNYYVTHQETLEVVRALKHFMGIIHGYIITVFADKVAATELFKCRNLTGRLARWYLTMQKFNSTFKYLPCCANVVADTV